MEIARLLRVLVLNKSRRQKVAQCRADPVPLILLVLHRTAKKTLMWLEKYLLRYFKFNRVADKSTTSGVNQIVNGRSSIRKSAML